MKKIILLLGSMMSLILTNISVAKDDISLCKNSDIWYQGRVTSVDEGDATFLSINIKNKGKITTIDAGCDSDKCYGSILNQKVRVKLYTTSMEEGMDEVCYVKEIDMLAAQSDDKEENLFYCKTKNNKQVSVIKKGNYIFYAFGRNLQNPEMKLKKELYEVPMRYEMYSGGGGRVITVENDKYSYELLSGIRSACYGEDCTPHHEEFGSITVYKGDKILAEIECDASTVTPK